MKLVKKIILGIAIFISAFVCIGSIVFCFVGSYKSIHPPRQLISKTPSDYGLDYQNIEFKSSDGLTLKGWWIPNNSNTTIIVTHGYGANRAGWNGKDKKGQEVYIDWLAGSIPLYHAGYSLLLFDLRASGESEGDVVTLGYHEKNDVSGAINWVLGNNGQVGFNTTENIGLLGFSMGGNVALRGGLVLKEILTNKQIKSAAIVAVGPTIYNTMIDKSLGFWSGGLPTPSFLPPLFKKAVSIRLGFDVVKELNPTHYVSEISPIPIMYIQSEKDEIGDVSDVQAMFDATKNPKKMIIIPDALRFEHYRYPAEHPEKVSAFFSKYFS
ncbi:MAG: alpha/beta hydrolase [SAR324 cluster bacterium]|nr:alpha/beta hydrolase [SAR324 cluster bacterium]